MKPTSLDGSQRPALGGRTEVSRNRVSLLAGEATTYLLPDDGRQLAAPRVRNGMLLGGVAVEEQLVRKLAAVMDKSLRHKLDVALLFRADTVGLTREERRAILAALETKPELGDIRTLLLADSDWRAARGR